VTSFCLTSFAFNTLQELGGEQPGPEFSGPPGPDRDRGGSRGRSGLGLHERDRDGRDRGPPGSDPCHLYVGYIAAHVTDQMLEGLFRRCVEGCRAECSGVLLCCGVLFRDCGCATVLCCLMHVYRPVLGLHERDSRDGRDGWDRDPPGSDPCHLYVGYIAAHVDRSHA
jgi:hypothetical protein